MKSLTLSDHDLASYIAGQRVFYQPVKRYNSLCVTANFSDLDMAKAWRLDSWKFKGMLHAPTLNEDGTSHRVWPRFESGETVYIREAWGEGLSGEIVCKADWPDNDGRKYIGKVDITFYPAITMPERAARFRCKIVSVRPEMIGEWKWRVELDPC
jgi:hypothetical protein